MSIGIHPDMNGTLTVSAQCLNNKTQGCGQPAVQSQEYGAVVDENSVPDSGTAVRDVGAMSVNSE